MLAAASRQWWVLVVEGVLGVVFGALALLLPGLTLVTLAYLFAAWAVISGVVAIVEGMRVAEERGRSWPFAITGAVSIVAGVLAALLPGPTISALMILLGAWLVVGGVAHYLAAYRIREQVDDEWLIALVGAIRVVAGLVILLFPMVGALLTVAYISWSAIVAGVIAIAMGLRLRRLRTATAWRVTAAR
ncbi:MAG: HdeD family acid-resistance protein [Candidatus Limnocylindrales bacterium]